MELSSLYRQNAKPNPPERFKLRIREDVLNHCFSNHDNKQAFLNDSTLFGSGIGKKKIESVNKSLFDPQFISWKTSFEPIRQSIYQRDYCHYSRSQQKLTKAIDSLNEDLKSVYEKNFSHGEPDEEGAKSIRKETVNRYKKNIQKPSQEDKLNVADCLVWRTYGDTDITKKKQNIN
jgi:hypothetical protein